MYLVACFYLSSSSHPSYTQNQEWRPIDAEAEFLKRTRRALSGNLAMAENLFDFLQATCLLSRYLYYRTRMAQAHHECAGTPNVKLTNIQSY
jgi:hypothetical protein